MSPPGQSPQSLQGHTRTPSAEPYYSNEDVAILHDIVLSAQDLLPKLPRRERLPTTALFDAYHDTLPRLGINADHDSRFARVLFKIGGLRGEGTMYERFEQIMARMGIILEHGSGSDFADEEDEYEEEDSNKRSQVEESATGGTTLPRVENDPTHTIDGLQRRNSESSKWDLGLQTKEEHREKRSASIDATPELHPDGRPKFLDEIEVFRTTGIHESPNEGPYGDSSSVEDVERSYSTDHQHENSAISLGDVARVRAADHQYRQTKRLMETKARLMQEYLQKSSSKRYLRQWRDKALQLRKRRLILEAVGERFDRRVLFSAALQDWRAKLAEIRRVRETETFFAQLERRATKARDLYLKLKVLEHWSNYSQEHVERTSAAREHILKTKCFNAWAEVTAVNELKVRRHITKKFFTAWKTRCVEVSARNNKAVQVYEENLVEKVYRNWVQKLWEQKANALWEQNVKRRTLFHWISAYHKIWEQNRVAEDKRHNHLLFQAQQAWKQKRYQRIQQEESAAAFYRATICRKAIQDWRRETKVLPAKHTLENDLKYRMVQKCFDKWRHRTRQETEATTIYRKKILREALTTWRHQMRLKIMQHKVNGRLAETAIYRIVIAQRLSIVQREKKDLILRNSIRNWAEKSRRATEARLQQEEIARGYAIQKAQNTALALFYKQMSLRQEREQTAEEFRNPRLLREIVSKMKERTAHIQKLEKWCQDAQFYFLATKALKRWKAATEASKREKRKQAFIHVRRRRKINLARGIIQHWREKIQRIRELENQAHEVRHNKLVVIGMNCFDQWRARAAEVAEMEAVAREHAVKKQFVKWKGRLHQLGDMNMEATLTYQENQQGRIWRKWNLELLKQRAQERYATEVRQKNQRKGVRKLLQKWKERTAEKRPIGELQEGTASVYYNTPSKRRRARPSTTPRVFLSTPYERQLRATYE